MPRVLRVDPERPDPAAIADAVAVLRAGGLVAFPTETVYGLGARATDERAVARVFEAKGRPSAHPLIAHVAGEAGARAIAAEWSARASRLAKACWPGPLTLVVPRGAAVPAIVAGGGDSIAVRAPSHPVARAILEALGEPVAAPSANRYQTLSPTLAAHVVKSLGDRVDLVLDGGACASGIESTVVDVRCDPPRVLRLGALSIEALRAIEPDIAIASSDVARDDVRPSPGMDARHYAPRASLVVASSREDAIARALAHLSRGESVGLVARGSIDAPGALVKALPADAEGYASALFAALHALDDAGVRAIVVEPVPADEAWSAVADRLRRASASG